MAPVLSRIGSKLSRESGIFELMRDLGEALSKGGVNMLGGGNPAAIPEIEKIWRDRMFEILSQGRDFELLIGNYDTAQGRPKFISSLVQFFNCKYGWKITESNIAITNGSQSGFFLLFNMLAGEFKNGERKKILFPISPEYIGYADQGFTEDLFISARPKIKELGAHLFRYCVDFESLPLDPSVAAIALSRPTNPTGNVISDEELKRLVEITEKRGIYLCIDNAYGAPFPNVIFKEATLPWAEQIIHSFSLSKVGLPGVRTGIFIGNEKIVKKLCAANAIAALANTNVGQEIVTPFFVNGEISELCKRWILPFYTRRLEAASSWIEEFFPHQLPYSFHCCDGAFFLWLWCRELPISAQELYQRLKQRKTLVVPGNYFFFGLTEPWQHTKECIRINYSQPSEVVKEGIKVLAEEITRAYQRK